MGSTCCRVNSTFGLTYILHFTFVFRILHKHVLLCSYSVILNIIKHPSCHLFFVLVARLQWKQYMVLCHKWSKTDCSTRSTYLQQTPPNDATMCNRYFIDFCKISILCLVQLLPNVVIWNVCGFQFAQTCMFSSTTNWYRIVYVTFVNVIKYMCYISVVCFLTRSFKTCILCVHENESLLRLSPLYVCKGY